MKVALVVLVAILLGVVSAAPRTAPPGQHDAGASRPVALYGAWVLLHPDSAASSLPAPLSPDALRSRPVFDTDRPVNPDLIARVAATGAHVRMVSRWLRAVAVDADSISLARLKAMPAVVGIARIRSASEAGGAEQGLNRSAAWRLQSSTSALPGVVDSAYYGATTAALRELNIPVLHELGFTGTGVRVGIIDSGFFLSHESLAGRLVAAQFDFINRRPGVGNQPGDAVDQARHGTAVMSLFGGFAPGRLVGGAYSASFHLAKVRVAGELDSRGDEDRWVEAVEWADALNVRLINSSIGFRDRFSDRENIPYGDLDGNTTITTRMADEAARRGMLIIVATGNSGPQAGSIWAPADADSVLSVGAIDSLTAQRAAVPLPLSSRGPTADGRTKPELVARGSRIVAASTFSLTAYEANLTGSSYAAPFVSAGATLFMEAWPNLSVMAVRQALLLAGSKAGSPDNIVGHGVPDVAAAIMFPEGLLLSASSLATTDLQGNLTTIVPRFSWFAALIHPRMRPIRYTVEVARDSLFQNIIYADTVEESFQHSARAPLRPVERAWWRVVARSPQGIQRVTAARPSFRVPSWVRLLTLNEPEAVFTDDARPQLDWAPLSAPEPIGPFIYDVQIISVATTEIVQQMRNLTSASVRVTEPLTANQAYRWRVIARTRTGVADTVLSRAPFVIQSAEAPPATILYQNFPNPFPTFASGSSTRIWFDLAHDGPVELAVYDLRGRLVRRLIPARSDCGVVSLKAGLYGRSGQLINSVVDEGCALTSWDGADERGQVAPRGVYLLRLQAGGLSEVRRMLFMPDQ
jgi:serine protease AprX